MNEGKHKFKIHHVEDFFLFKRIYFMCEGCFVMCIMDREDLYKALILDEHAEFRWE